MIFSLLLWSAAVLPPPSGAPPVVHKSTQNGISVTMTVSQARATDHADLREGDDVAIRFEVSDDATHSPIRGARPGAWMDPAAKDQTKPRSCKDRVRVYATNSLVERAEVDLNSFDVVAMNDDETLSVVDPRFGFGGTRLLALVQLPSAALDWVLTNDKQQLWLSLPKSKQLALVDTVAWKTTKLIDLPSAPGRVVLQPDEGYLWTTVADGVVAIRPADRTIAVHIATGAGVHDIAASTDSRFLFVTNRDAGTVSAIDIQKLKKLADFPAGSAPVSISWSPLASAAFVASEDGTITAIGGSPFRVLSRVQSEPGLTRIRVSPDGRLALAVNPAKNRVYVVDTSGKRIVQKATIAGAPDAVYFSNSIAYVRLRDENDVQMITLAGLGGEGKDVPIADFPAGQAAFGKGSLPSAADSIVTAVGEDAVLVANPADQTIYYYREGMAAPMGNFPNYGKQPRAVLVVDRSLRERKPGVYETVRRIEHPGDYEVALYLDSPKLIDCYAVSFAADPRVPHEKPHAFAVQLTAAPATVRSGERVSLQFRVSDRGAVAKADDATVLIFSPMWQSRARARNLGDGIYAVEFTPPSSGLYSAYLSSPALGMPFTFFASLSAQ